jgi:hypothetical protein
MNDFDSTPATIRAAVKAKAPSDLYDSAGPFIDAMEKRAHPGQRMRAVRQDHGFVVYIFSAPSKPRRRASFFFETNEDVVMALVDTTGDAVIGEVCASQAGIVVERALRHVNDQGWEEP